MTPTERRPRSKQPGGRRKGDVSTRDAILQAAIETFAERGYEGATLRAITTKAGVDVALVSHFFGSKQGLFEEAVLRHGSGNLQRMMEIVPGADPARQLLEAYFSVWEHPDTALSVRALFRSALESEDNRARLQSLLSERLTEGLRLIAGQHGPGLLAELDEHPEEVAMRVQLLAAHLLGIGISRFIMRIQPMADLSREGLIGMLAPIIESYLPAGLAPRAFPAAG